jgi:hypothetical protein
MTKPKRCPICDGWIPNNDTPGKYPGALSRKDNKTEICSECGVMEAMQGYESGMSLMEELINVTNIHVRGE